METFSALLALCEGNPPAIGGFPSQGSDAELWCFSRSAPEQTVEQTSETPVIVDAITLTMASLSFVRYAFTFNFHTGSEYRKERRGRQTGGRTNTQTNGDDGITFAFVKLNIFEMFAIEMAAPHHSFVGLILVCVCVVI